jgi:hypothetical protein
MIYTILVGLIIAAAYVNIRIYKNTQLQAQRIVVRHKDIRRIKR